MMGPLLLTTLFYCVVVLILGALIAEFLGTRSGNGPVTAEDGPDDENPA
jgi:hypothetical protein